ncbi:hypothetical protein VTH06DRAFT_4723 [Thermothelomyces fergusii]
MLIVWGVVEFNVGNMVSSLPFLAPIFLRKARQYTTKYGGSGNNYGSGAHRMGKASDVYKLSGVSSQRMKGTFATVQGQSAGSEENILKANPEAAPENTIMKSVTYSVRVE